VFGLIQTYLSVQDTWYYHKALSYGSLEADADKSGWYFDWEPVVRECFPEVLVVMSGERREERRFPAYVVVPRVGDWIELPSNPKQLAVVAEEMRPSPRVGEAMMEGLRSLRKMAQSLPAERIDDVMKHINAIQRAIKPVA
jgi:hypothetical protein